MTAPDVRGRLRAIRARGGRVVVVDPRRTRTAQEADEHVAIRPGTDAFLLLAMVHVLVTEDLVDLGDAAPHVAGVDAVRELALGCTPEDAAERCGIDGGHDPPARARPRRRRPRRGLRADRHDDAAVRHRRELARRRPEHAHGQPRPPGRRDVRDARRRARGTRRARPGAAGARGPRGTPAACAGCPRSFGELPVAALAEEIETPGPGQVRALLTIAGNPVLSTPNAGRLDAALGTLDFMVSVDLYLNETTRHADVVLPAPLAAGALALRPRLHGPLDPRRGELLARGGGAAAGRARRVADAPAPARGRDRPGRGRRRRRDRRRDRRRGRAPGRRRRALAPGRPGRGRGARRARAAHRPRAPARPRAAHGALPAHAGRPGGGAARPRPRPAQAAPARGPADAEREGRARARAAARRRPPPRGGARGAHALRRADAAHRPPRPALEQLVDAQPAGARAREGALHRPCASRRRRPPRAHRRRAARA